MIDLIFILSHKTPKSKPILRRIFQLGTKRNQLITTYQGSWGKRLKTKSYRRYMAAAACAERNLIRLINKLANTDEKIIYRIELIGSLRKSNILLRKNQRMLLSIRSANDDEPVSMPKL